MSGLVKYFYSVDCSKGLEHTAMFLFASRCILTALAPPTAQY